MLGRDPIAGGLFMASWRTWSAAAVDADDPRDLLVVAIFLRQLPEAPGPLFAMGSVLQRCLACRRRAPMRRGARALSIGVCIVGVTWFARTEARMSKQQTLLTAALVMAGGLVLGLTVPTLALDLPDSSLSATQEPTSSPLFPYLLALFGVFVGIKVAPAVRDPRPDRVQPAVKRAVLGLVLLDAILATSLVGWPGLFIVVLLLPAMWIGRWLYST